ncbi:MAG: GvpL/GvpF family gas vesicle protein [Chloroflexi bacterium]|nr:GvpL/GvpF family gas vesicle protein [Chloroflexota bacterium]
MSLSSIGPGTASTAPEPDTERAARYVYCLAAIGEPASLGAIGIEGREVYTVVHRSLGALVHDGPPRPYETRDQEQAAGWVLAHHRVVEAAWQRWGTVLPMTFNTLIAPAEKGAHDSLLAWLGTEHDSLKRRLDAFAGKAEYGVQVSWNTAHFARQVAQTDPEVNALEKQIGSQSRGLAYMYRQRLESLVRKGVEARAALEFKELYSRISQCVDQARIEKTRVAEGEWAMLLNLSCLVSVGRVPGLKAQLDRIESTDGLSVRLAGPWPPYSFC